MLKLTLLTRSAKRNLLRLALAILLSVPATLIAAPLATTSTAPTNQSQAINSHLADKPAVKTFIAEMVKKHGFSGDYLRGLFNTITFKPRIVKAMKHPYEKQPWFRYQKHFLTSERIADGLAFITAHRATLARAEREYGVPAEIITAIIGVESHFGRHQGKYSVLSSLATLAFDYPSRAKYFRRELAQFLLFTREEGFDPHTIKGSYAGAIGQAQFMPSSYRAYAVDFSGDGKRDLRHNTSDAIGSVANYLKQHGWQRGASIALPVKTSARLNLKQLAKLPLKQLKPKRSLLTLSKRYGVSATLPLSERGDRVSLLRFQGAHAPQYWLGFQNFYSITRYNTSPLYAMAVYQLSERYAQAEQRVLASSVIAEKALATKQAHVQ